MAAALIQISSAPAGPMPGDIAAAGLREDRTGAARLMTGRPNMSTITQSRCGICGMLSSIEMYILADGGTVWPRELKGLNHDRGPNAAIVRQSKLGI